MCGRVAQAKNPVEYGSILKINFARGIPNSPPHYNGAPSQDYLVALVDPDRDDFALDLIRWGLVPHYSKDGKVKLINAMAETADTKAAFAESFVKRRCLVPIDGFFEWKKIGKRKQPYMIAMADRQPFTLAGLWRDWKDLKSGDWVRTFTIITTEANELVATIHDRMLVVIAPEDRERWVEGPNPKELLKPYPADLMTMWPVSPDLNSPKNDRPDLLDPIEEPEGDGEPVKRADDGDADREPTNSD